MVCIYIYNEILLSRFKKEWNLAVCDNIDGPRGHYAKWSKSDRERQIPYDLPYMCNLKENQNQTNKKPIYRENRVVVATGRG